VLLQALRDGTESLAAGVLDRSAPEGGEAGAEDHAGVQQVRIRDHPLPQAGGGFVEQAQDDAGLQVRGMSLGALGTMGLSPLKV